MDEVHVYCVLFILLCTFLVMCTVQVRSTETLLYGCEGRRADYGRWARTWWSWRRVRASMKQGWPLLTPPFRTPPCTTPPYSTEVEGTRPHVLAGLDTGRRSQYTVVKDVGKMGMYHWGEGAVPVKISGQKYHKIVQYLNFSRYNIFM